MFIAIYRNRIRNANSIGIYLLLALAIGGCGTNLPDSDSKPVSHDTWTELLRKHVDSTGGVNYQGFIADSIRLNEYLSTLENALPNNKNWTRNEQLAYWINTYNAFTIRLIIRHYPIKSIKDIKSGLPFVNSVWDIEFIRIEDAVLDLTAIEHDILREQFDEPRIHFAIVCASVSCPKLLNEAYVADRIEEQLESAAFDFINDSTRNNFEDGNAELSKIFDWFEGDFESNGRLVEYLNRYLEKPLNEDVEMDFLNYDWSLNEAKQSAP